MKNLLCIIAAAAMLCGCAGTYFTFDKAQEVKLGMSEAEVRQIMGKPFAINSNAAGEVWAYVFVDGFGASRSVSFVFDNGKVVDVPKIPASFIHK